MPKPPVLRIAWNDIQAKGKILHQHYYWRRRREMKRTHYLLGASSITLLFLLTSCASFLRSYSKPDLRILSKIIGSAFAVDAGNS
jgi:hypothetical protein